MRAAWTFAAACMLACAGAQGQPVTYKCVDNAGRSTYTNVREEMSGKKCVAVSREVSVVPTQPPASKAAAPAASSNAARASDRRKILEEELGSEEKRLAEAKERLAEQQSIRNGDERNYQRVLDRLKPYVDAVEQHEKNISQLRRELSSIR